MLDHGLLTPEEALKHPMRHVLARAVGVGEDLQIDAVRDILEPRDVFLLCSDGLYGQVSDDEIAEALRKNGVDACTPLIEICLAAGAPDNITVTIVAAYETTLFVQSGDS
jgi:serine/threonine protein phosphatase PrpC